MIENNIGENDIGAPKIRNYFGHLQSVAEKNLKDFWKIQDVISKTVLNSKISCIFT